MKRFMTLLCILSIFTYTGYGSEWAVQGKSHNAWANSVAVGKDGTLFVAGNFSSFIQNGNKKIAVKNPKANNSDMYIAAYNPDGDLLWMRTAGGPDADNGYTVAVTDDAVYVNAYFTKSMEFDDGTQVSGTGLYSLAVVKYDYEGNLLWVQTATDEENMWARDLAVDGDGNAYLVGFFTKGATFGKTKLKPSTLNKNIFIVKYSSDGKQEWVRQAAGGDSYLTGIYEDGIVIGPDGSVFIAGYMSGPVQFEKFEYKTSITKFSKTDWLYNYEAFIAKYTPAGKFEWMKPVGVDIEPEGFAIDGDGNFYMTGFFKGILYGKEMGKAVVGNLTIKTTVIDESVTEDIFIAKWDKNCKAIWAKTAGGPGVDRAHEIAVGADGTLAITGGAAKDAVFDKKKLKVNPSEGVGWDIFVAWYNTDGKFLGIETAGGAGTDMGNGVAVDGDGGVYAAGNFQKDSVFGKQEFSIIKYSDSFIWKVK
jgi:hypothetical protein